MTAARDREFSAFVAEHGDALLRLSRYLIGDDAEAEDVLQTALLRVLRHWGRDLDNPAGYTRQVVVNLARDRGRRRHLVGVPVAETRDVETTSDASEALIAHEQLLALLSTLPARQRVTVVLRVVEDLSEAETATLLGCAKGTVKSNLARGLGALRASLTAESPIGDLA